MALHNQRYIACHECDALLRKRTVLTGQKLCCPRCGCNLVQPRDDTVNRGMALSLAALIMVVPSITLPIMTFDILGLEQADTMIKGVVQLAGSGQWWMASIVFFCTIAAPVMELVLVLSICILVKLDYLNGLLIGFLKLQSTIKRWAMLEVFMLGIIVAYVKMLNDGDIQVGFGLFCFIGLLLLTTLNAYLFDTHEIWEKIGKHREKMSEHS